MHLTADISVSDEFQNDLFWTGDSYIIARLKQMKLPKYKRYQNITLYQCMVGSFDRLNIKCRKLNTKYIF